MATAATPKAKPKAHTGSAPGTGPLQHLVPPRIFAEEYVSRRIEGVKDLDLLNYAREARVNTLLFGPTGPGKTSMILAYCAARNIPLATIQCNGAVDPNTFWGGLVIDPKSGALKGWQDSEILEVIKHGGVLYLDEFNFLPAKVAATFHGLLDKRRQVTILDKGNEVVVAHKDLQVIAAYNPDYEGTRPLNAATKNRFRIKIRLDYDPEVEAQILCLPIMQDLAASLRTSQRRGELETPVSTNMLIEFEELALDLGYGFALSNFLNAFLDEERAAVKEVFDLNSERIREQVAQMEALSTES